MRVSVVVPTYRRPERLRECLRGIRAQQRPAEQVVVVRRRDDEQSRSVLAEHAGALTEVVVDRPGLVEAMYAGFAASTGDLIALTDDDAVPRPDWLARIARRFADDPALGVLGGRDVIPHHPLPDRGGSGDVGRITWWGRLIGNHHVGRGRCRDVDVLKGVNLAVRRSAAALPAGMRGRGTQLHWEVALCQWARNRGWRVVYDPELLVDHYPAQRPAGDLRTAPAAQDVAAEAYNLVAGLLSQRPELYWRRAAYGLSVGDAAVPGVARAAYALVRSDVGVARRFLPSFGGQLAALRDVRRGEVPSPRPVEPTPEPLRVTLVAHDIHGDGGMERAQAELIRRVGARVAFTVVSAQLAPELRHRVVRWKRVPVPRRPFPLKFAAFYLLAGVRLGRAPGQLVHACGAVVPNRVDLATVHLCHAGLITTTRRLAPPDVSLPRRLNSALSRVLAILAERWTYGRPRTRSLAVVSPDLHREVLAHYATVPVLLTRNGVDVVRFAPNAAVRAEVRRRESVADTDLVAVFVGGDWGRKGLRTTIEALSRAAQDGAAVRLWVVGSGEEQRYRTYARRCGVGDQVTFFGRRTDTETFYRAADVLVLPTLYEAFSLVTLEAAAAGLPVVMTPVNGAADLVGRDEAGILVERTPDSVAAALVRLARDPALRRRLGHEGRRRVSAWSWEANVDRVVEAYRELSQPTRPVPEAAGAR